MLRFTWDPRKARRNLAKHRVSFEEASTVFGDPLTIDIDDPSHSKSEQRFVILGTSLRGRLLVVAYSEPESDSIRIISARKPRPHEREEYEKGH